MAWRFAQCWGKKARLEAYLKEGWDPFAVTETWLRRSGSAGACQSRRKLASDLSLAKRDQCRQLEDPDVDRQLRRPGRDQGKEAVGK